MGLPLFITPKEAQRATKSPEKVVAVPRSAIRRRSIPRPRHTSNSLRRRLLGSFEQSREDAYQIWEGRTRSSALDNEISSLEVVRAGNRRNLDEQRAQTREPTAIGREGILLLEHEGSIMPAVPEANLFTRDQDRLRGLQRARQVARDHTRRLARRHAAPTPPYFDQDVESGDYPFPPSPLLTSSITPTWSATSPSGRRSPQSPAGDTSEARSFSSRMQDIQQRPSLTERVRALNRAATDLRRSHNQFRRARILQQASFDGLGDRNRSLSPENGLGAWDTLLTSITPDPQPPSEGSSFASSSAAGRTTTSQSVPHSASTSMTSFSGPQDSIVLECDLSDDSNTEEEDEEDAYEIHEFDTGARRDGLEWRTFSSAILSEPINTRQGIASPEHLDGMHRIISRLAERNEIPDEWWASAGLSRNLRRVSSTRSSGSAHVPNE